MVTVDNATAQARAEREYRVVGNEQVHSLDVTRLLPPVALKWAIGWRLGRSEMNVWGFHYYRRWTASLFIAWAWARLSVFYTGTYISALWWRALGMQVSGRF